MTNATTMPVYAAYLRHSDWSDPVFFVSVVSEEDAMAKATAHLMSITGDYRDHDEYPDDDSWIDVCLSEEWTMEAGSVEG